MKPFQYSFLIDFKCPKPEQVNGLYSILMDSALEKMREHRVDVDVVRPHYLLHDPVCMGAMAIFVVSPSRDVAESVQYAAEDAMLKYVQRFDFTGFEIDFVIGDLQAHHLPDDQVDRALEGRLDGLNNRAVEGLFQLKELIESAIDRGMLDESALGSELFGDVQDCLVDINRQTRAKSMLSL